MINAQKYPFGKGPSQGLNQNLYSYHGNITDYAVAYCKRATCDHVFQQHLFQEVLSYTALVVELFPRRLLIVLRRLQ